MLVSIIDRMMFGDRQITADGYLATVGKISRSGTQEYLGSELGRPEMDRVTVYRDADEVFDEDAIRSFAYKPVTDDHPPVSVTSKNWRTYSRGQLGGKALRDGEHLEFPMVVMDQGLIDKINNGKAELSAGYTAEIEFTDGVAPDGTPYQAKMTKIRGNHCAVVDRGRALTARIGDAWPVDVEDASPNDPKPKKETRKVKTFTLDGLPVRFDDEAAIEAAFAKLTDNAAKANERAEAAAKALTDAEVAHAAALKDANDAKSKAEAEVASLTKELADSKITPEQLREAAKAYAMVIDAAAKIAPNFKVEDSMTEADIRKGAILSVFGDAYKDKADTFFDALFEVEAAKVKDKQAPIADPYRQQMGDRKVVDFADAAQKAKAARDEMIAGFNKRNRADAE